jgi:enoyl-CoA hydratase
LRAALRTADEDDTVDVIVLTGADPSFCDGLELADLVSPERRAEMAAAVFSSSSPWEPTIKPLIGAINGPTQRGGLEIALYCDILVASERATFADTHAALGFVSALGMTAMLPRAVGLGLAVRMSLTGTPLRADQALAAGLVTEVVEHDNLLGAALRLAEEVVRNPQVAVRRVLGSYRRAESRNRADSLRIELEAHLRHLDAAANDQDLASVRSVVFERVRSEPPPGTGRP